MGMHSLGFVAAIDDDAHATQRPAYQAAFGQVARERGWPMPTHDHYLSEVAHGSLFVGSPQTVATRIAAIVRTLGLSRFHLHYAVGAIPHEQRMTHIELFGRQVIPMVRELLADG